MDAPVETVMEGAFGPIELDRFPVRGGSTLRAWDAADAYALDALDALDAVAAAALPASPRCLVVGDRFGALAISLARGLPGATVTSMGDSWLSHRALAHNLSRNGMPAEVVAPLPSTGSPAGVADLVLVRIPRSLALLEDQLRRIRPATGPDTVVIGLAMARHVHTSTLTAIESVLGPTATSLARRKARLIHVTHDPDLAPGPPAGPVRHETADGVQVLAHAAVFAHGRLDRGTAVLLAHLPDVDAGAVVVDLGCGDGVVGLSVAARHPDADLVFTDESYMAVASARAGWALAYPSRPARFLLGDGMDGVGDASVDLVLVNPPFHDDHAVGDEVAWEMFVGARRALRPGGRLVVVGNRHLAHHAKLSRLFGGSRTLGSTPRFVVLEARSRDRSGGGTVTR